MAILRGKIRWTIPGAGTAYSVLHFGTDDGFNPEQADVDTTATMMNQFITTVKSTLPNVVQMQVVNELEEIDSNNGQMIALWTTPTLAAQAGTASAAAGWAAAAGGVISWSTGIVHRARRIRGRTFIVPMSNEVWDIDGTIKAVPLGQLNTAATALRDPAATVRLGVFARPSAPGATDGRFAPVSGHRVPDMSAILRSRRS
jgi:hypothetical protein